MTVAALITWTVTAFAGLYLLAIWLIEYDVSAPGGAPTRLPRTVISGHVLLASSGLVVWVSYLIVDRDLLAWIALATLVAVALLGLTMLGRWVMVRRALSAPLRARSMPGRTGQRVATPAGAHSAVPVVVADTGRTEQRVATPPESHFPVPVVVAHGLLATSTITLVALTVLGVGGS
jgi:hypothetical protein